MENQTKESDPTTEGPPSDNSDYEDETENKENEDEEITFGDSDKLDNMITKKKVKKWKIIKVHVDKTEEDENSKTSDDFPKSTYLQRRQMDKQTPREDTQESKAVKLEKIYNGKHQSSFIVKVVPNKDFVPEGWPRKPHPDSMPRGKGRFQYTCNAYGAKLKDVNKTAGMADTKKKKKNKVKKTTQNEEDMHRKEEDMSNGNEENTDSPEANNDQTNETEQSRDTSEH